MLSMRPVPFSFVCVALTPPPFHSPQALYVYEYAITLFDEIRYVWKHKYSFATFLFTVNRYAVWIETALQLYITFGDLATVDVSDLGIFTLRLTRIDPSAL